ncbi:hypothetical protein [Stenotrophomonas sp. PS02301]|uniref:hypothetical protein n=1 Tax=Stenotrophomonas sp. PS02301 TaxID=2991427 RepID=UPI002499BA1C|nr:hypothetical protein [Stenotrophomonas sp. PS02301]
MTHPVVLAALLAALSLPPLAAASDLDGVLERLRAEIAAVPADDPAPIDTVLARYRDETGIDLQIPVAGDSDAPLPALVRPANVTPADWDAVTRYLRETDAQHTVPVEMGELSLSLLDLDGDGQRDLVQSAYSGGTGLYTQVDMLRRNPLRGFVVPDRLDPQRPLAQGQYGLSGRGSDQGLYWLRIDGVSYIAYRDGDYYGDTLLLNRPLSADPRERSPTTRLQVRYGREHRLADPAVHADGEPLDANATAIAADRRLLKHIERLLAALTLDGDGVAHFGDAQARCPVPPGTDPGEAEIWPWRGAGSYTFDTAADTVIRSGKQCYSATLIALRSSYAGDHALCCQLWLYRGPGEQVATLDLRSRRWVSGVTVVPVPPQGE